MKKAKKLLNAWVDAGMPQTKKALVKYQITKDVLFELEKSVMKGIANQQRRRTDVTTFQDHKTVQ